MPQLDIVTFSHQFSYFFIIFNMIYLTTVMFILPKYKLIESVRSKIN